MKTLNCSIGKQIPKPIHGPETDPPLVCDCVDMNSVKLVAFCAVGVLVIFVLSMCGLGCAPVGEYAKDDISFLSSGINESNVNMAHELVLVDNNIELR
ncbi:MAG TPA: hypothetical protein DEP85_04860 [Holosporales bacterium]|nr:hypothetical protein [Holosporales bacterium]